MKLMRLLLGLVLVVLLIPTTAGANTVRLVGNDFQSIVNQNPAGTTYVISAGEHRMQQVVPKAGDIFIGELGPKGKLLSALNGSLLITNWEQPVGTYWVTRVQMIPGYQYFQGQCVGDDPDTSTFVGVCQYPEVLFKNNEFMQRKKCQAPPQEAANCLSQLDGPNQYFIAYDCPRAGNGDCDPSKPVTGTQVVYLLLAGDENPNCYAIEPTNAACPKLELAVTPFAFGEDLEPITPAINRDSHPVAPKVTVKNLIVEKYANPGQFGAIGNHYPGYDWLVEGNEVRLIFLSS